MAAIPQRAGKSERIRERRKANVVARGAEMEASSLEVAVRYRSVG